MFVAAASMGTLVAGTSAQAAGPPVLAWSLITSRGTYDFGAIDDVAERGAPNAGFFCARARIPQGYCDC
jgi:hypothetical protein